MHGAVAVYDRSLYRLTSSASLLARIYFCYLTIEQFPIFDSLIQNWLFGLVVPVYGIFLCICYPVTGYISGRFGIQSPTARSIIYFMVYVPAATLYWLILLLMTKMQILPI